MLRQKSSCFNWQLLLLGLIFIITGCNARAVNVSNTWTMPQEGLNVFYRFFRDRISWFEADAVCQFHHANLVTVDNSFQFDATRDLLRELDVNDIVWIGLMRPQSSDRFMWSSNSRPLVADTGYWAESLPLMDAPLCAVIDPIRDYRWHALRCGGPETASFLCEMPVPSWADACNLKDMPNLTLQYMADTASIELIRNCQEEGLLRTMCRGKQDRERALQDLICPRERLEAQRINDITNSHFKSLQIINSIPSDNNENNDIELLPLDINYGSHFPEETQTEKNTVQRLIEQFNVDELMQADERSSIETAGTFYKIPGLIPKPVKKSAKKALDSSDKKDGLKTKSNAKTQKEIKKLPLEMDDMMMGDQPLQGEPEMPEQFLNEEVSNEILEHLPHIKKTNLHKEDSLEKMEIEAMTLKKNLQKSKELENKKLYMTTVAPLPSTTTSKATSFATTTTDAPLTTFAASTTTKTEHPVSQAEDSVHKIHQTVDSTWLHLATTTAAAPIGHPIHPQTVYNNGFKEEGQHLHTKEASDNSHFIPPMLMVKSHYVPPASKHGHNDFDHHQHHQPHLNVQQPSGNLETTTEEHSQPAKELPPHQSQDIKEITLTTPQVPHLQSTTLRNLDTSLNSSLTTSEKDSSMKPIIKEMEQPRNSTTALIFEETQTTATAKTLRSDDFTAATKTTVEITALPADRSQEKNNNNNSNGGRNSKDKNYSETYELKIPQSSHAAPETTPATKLLTTITAVTETEEESLNFTQKLYDLVTTPDATHNIKETADISTTIIPAAQHQQQDYKTNKKPTEEILTAAKQQENKEHLQITMEATEKLAPPQTAQLPTTAITTTISASASESPTMQQPTALVAQNVRQSLHGIEKEQTNKETLKEEEQNNREETVVKTTETQQTSTAATKVAKPEEKVAADEEEKQEEKQLLRTTFAPTTSTSLTTTTTTTVKPITTTLSQILEKSTQTSHFSTSIYTSTTTPPTTTTATAKENTTTNNNKIGSSTTASPSSTISITSSDIPSTTQPPTTVTAAAAAARITTTVAATTTEAEPTSSRVVTSTQTSSAAPETTTRNFLKVTTDMPFKPNRRRSLTKPETVSYMKKILG